MSETERAGGRLREGKREEEAGLREKSRRGERGKGKRGKEREGGREGGREKAKITSCRYCWQRPPCYRQ
eukprot:1903031-Rhodomonas_salina.3